MVPSSLFVGRVESVNVGHARPLAVRGGEVRSGIFKLACVGPRHVGAHGFDGDVRVEPRKYGEQHHAVHAYPLEHYATWASEVGSLRPQDLADPFAPGGFGENLTVSGAREHEVHVGDVVRCGTAELVVSQPRVPCRRLTARVGIEGFSRMFMESTRVGYYLRVQRPGTIERGDPFVVIDRDEAAPTIQEFIRTAQLEYWDTEGLSRLLHSARLPEPWREPLEAKLKRASAAEARGTWFGSRTLRVRDAATATPTRLALDCPFGRPLPVLAAGRAILLIVGTMQAGHRAHAEIVRARPDLYEVLVGPLAAVPSPGSHVRCTVA